MSEQLPVSTKLLNQIYFIIIYSFSKVLFFQKPSFFGVPQGSILDWLNLSRRVTFYWVVKHAKNIDMHVVHVVDVVYVVHVVHVVLRKHVFESF